MTYSVSKGDKYKNYKGSTYYIIAMATHTESGEGLVIYTDNNHVWARPVEMFFGYLDDGTKRFEYIPEWEDF